MRWQIQLILNWNWGRVKVKCIKGVILNGAGNSITFTGAAIMPKNKVSALKRFIARLCFNYVIKKICY